MIPHHVVHNFESTSHYQPCFLQGVIEVGVRYPLVGTLVIVNAEQQSHYNLLHKIYFRMFTIIGTFIALYWLVKAERNRLRFALIIHIQKTNNKMLTPPYLLGAEFFIIGSQSESLQTPPYYYTLCTRYSNRHHAESVWLRQYHHAPCQI